MERGSVFELLAQLAEMLHLAEHDAEHGNGFGVLLNG